MRTLFFDGSHTPPSVNIEKPYLLIDLVAPELSAADEQLLIRNTLRPYEMSYSRVQRSDGRIDESQLNQPEVRSVDYAASYRPQSVDGSGNPVLSYKVHMILLVKLGYIF